MSSNGANRVREYRERLLMTQAELAERAGVALRTVHSIEKGMNCRMDTKRKVVRALGLDFKDRRRVFPETGGGADGGRGGSL